MRKAAGCVLLAILCLLGASYLPRILQEAQTDREQQNLISGYIQNPDTTDEENTESTTDEPEEETCLLYTSPSPRDLSTSRMPSSA